MGSTMGDQWFQPCVWVSVCVCVLLPIIPAHHGTGKIISPCPARLRHLFVLVFTSYYVGSAVPHPALNQSLYDACLLRTMGLHSLPSQAYDSAINTVYIRTTKRHQARGVSSLSGLLTQSCSDRGHFLPARSTNKYVISVAKWNYNVLIKYGGRRSSMCILLGKENTKSIKIQGNMKFGKNGKGNSTFNWTVPLPCDVQGEVNNRNLKSEIVEIFWWNNVKKRDHLMTGKNIFCTTVR